MPRKYKPRKDGRYGTKIYTGKVDKNGKLEYIDVYESSSVKLEKEVARIKSDMNRGTYADDRGTTFKEYAKKWLLTYKSGTSTANYKKYDGILKNHVSAIENTRLRNITKTDIQGLINEKSGHPDTQRMIKITVSQVLESAIEDGLIYRNVTRNIKVKQPKTQGDTRILSDSEKEAIKWCKEKVFDLRQKMFIDTLFVSGIRPGECLALSKADIKVKNKTISISKSLDYKGGKHLKEPKSEAGYRTINVPAWYIEEYKEYEKTMNGIYLFSGQDGGLFPQSTYKRFWKSIYSEINKKMGGTEDIFVTDLKPYVFRHNYCTMLYYLKIDIKKAQYLMGHSDIKITLGVYTHLAASESSEEEKVESIAL